MSAPSGKRSRCRTLGIVMTNKMNMRVIMLGDPGFKESLESGKCISGADIQAL